MAASITSFMLWKAITSSLILVIFGWAPLCKQNPFSGHIGGRRGCMLADPAVEWHGNKSRKQDQPTNHGILMESHGRICANSKGACFKYSRVGIF
jgi:hypothetical protein